jgi:phospholipid/cholesterol/gamma-HCH transport system permease protein
LRAGERIRGGVERLGQRSVGFVVELGKMGVFVGWILLALVRPPFRVRRLIAEIYETGVLSLAIICASAVTVGLVLGLQLYHVLVRFGSAESLGAVVGLTLIRELGPVLTGLLVTGRAGSAMAAEIGVMNATEQLDGMRTLAVDPIHYVVGPKFLAMILTMPLLASLFCVFAIFGAWLVGVQLLGLDHGVFLSSLENSVEFRIDVVGSLIKDVVFGVLIATIATWRGFTSGRSAAAVSRATTSTVVTASVCILLADYIVTSLWGF